jgi:four helix bundle protein
VSADEAVRSYRQLKVWQLAMKVAAAVYRLTANFPKHELYGLASQMQRAAVSAPSNIAEGNKRESIKEYLHHLSIAAGSLAEVETQLLLAAKLSYGNVQLIEDVLSQAAEVGKMLCGLQRSLRAKLNP